MPLLEVFAGGSDRLPAAEATYAEWNCPVARFIELTDSR